MDRNRFLCSVMEVGIGFGFFAICCLLIMTLLGCANATLFPIPGVEEWGATVLIYGFFWPGIIAGILIGMAHFIDEDYPCN